MLHRTPTVCRELSRYERALHEDYFVDAGSNAQMGKSVNHRVSCVESRVSARLGWEIGGFVSRGRSGAHSHNAYFSAGVVLWTLMHCSCIAATARPVQSLRYAKAAAIVRASAERVSPDMHGGDLPFIGDVTGVVAQCWLAGWLAKLAGSGYEAGIEAGEGLSSSSWLLCCAHLVRRPSFLPLVLLQQSLLAHSCIAGLRHTCTRSSADRRHHPDRHLRSAGLLQVRQYRSIWAG